MSEYHVEIRIRNNLILMKMQERGFDSLPAFCKAYGITYGTLLKFINMRESIYAHDGKLKPSIIRLCDKLQCSPEELFTATQAEASLANNKRTLKIKESEMKFYLDHTDQKLLEEKVHEDQLIEKVWEQVGTLTAREQKVIKMRFEDSATLEDCAKALDVTRERIRQIEAKALRKLRHSSHQLREYT